MQIPYFSLFKRNRSNRLLLASAGLVGLAAAPAAAQNQLWIQQFGTTSFETAFGGAGDGSGGIFLSGYTLGDLGGINQGGSDVWLARRSGTGAQLWAVQLGTVADDEALATTSDGAGGFFVAGRSLGALGGLNAGADDAWLAQYDSAGTQLWIQQLGTIAPDAAFGLATDGAGGVFVIGETEGDLGGVNAGFTDCWIARYDSTGLQLWINQFGTPSFDFARTATTDGNGGLYVAGATFGDLAGTNAGSLDNWVALYDGTGAQVWIQQFGSVDADVAYASAPDGAGGVYVAGGTRDNLGGPNAGDYDAWLARYDATGTQVWVKQLGTPATDEVHAAAVDGIGGVYVGGFAAGALGAPHTGGPDAWLARYDSTGAQVWIQQLGTAFVDALNFIVPIGVNAVLTGGPSSGSLGGANLGSVDVWVANYDANCGTNQGYCTALISSSGCEPSMSSTGAPSLTNPAGFIITARNIEPTQNGLMFYGATGKEALPFFGGTLCVGAPLYRMQIKDSGGIANCEGEYNYTLTEVLAHPDGGLVIGAGSVINCQMWYRDPPAALTVGLTHALEFTICL